MRANQQLASHQAAKQAVEWNSTCSSRLSRIYLLFELLLPARWQLL